MTPDWHGWHAPYDRPGSSLARRLRVVQQHIATWLADHAGREVRVVSVCAGQGRDLLEVLARTRDAATVRARLVERDPRNVAAMVGAVQARGLHGVEVVEGDAGCTDAYVGAVPADLVLLCGVFGNISEDDVRRTIDLVPQLCASQATVIWTRGRRPPDRTRAIRDRWADAGFAELAFDAPADADFSVGVHGLIGRPQALVPGLRLFTFIRHAASPAQAGTVGGPGPTDRRHELVSGRHSSLDDRFDPAVRIVDHDPQWERRAAEELRRVGAALGPRAVRLEHVGSTAVPGLAAKPILDLLVSVPDVDRRETYVGPLERLGYLSAPDPSSPGRHFFARPPERPRTHHLHVCEAGGEVEFRHLAVRDYLRAHRDEAAAYAALKRALVERHPQDRLAYIGGKDPYVVALESRAVRWARAAVSR